MTKFLAHYRLKKGMLQCSMGKLNLQTGNPRELQGLMMISVITTLLSSLELGFEVQNLMLDLSPDLLLHAHNQGVFYMTRELI